MRYKKLPHSGKNKTYMRIKDIAKLLNKSEIWKSKTFIKKCQNQPQTHTKPLQNQYKRQWKRQKFIWNKIKIRKYSYEIELLLGINLIFVNAWIIFIFTWICLSIWGTFIILWILFPFKIFKNIIKSLNFKLKHFNPIFFLSWHFNIFLLIIFILFQIFFKIHYWEAYWLHYS